MTRMNIAAITIILLVILIIVIFMPEFRNKPNEMLYIVLINDNERKMRYEDKNLLFSISLLFILGISMTKKRKKIKLTEPAINKGRE